MAGISRSRRIVSGRGKFSRCSPMVPSRRPSRAAAAIAQALHGHRGCRDRMRATGGGASSEGERRRHGKSSLEWHRGVVAGRGRDRRRVRQAARDDVTRGSIGARPRRRKRARRFHGGGASGRRTDGWRTEAAERHDRNTGSPRGRTRGGCASGAERVRRGAGRQGHLLRLRQVRRQADRRQDTRRQRGLVEDERQHARAHRRSLRRARYQRIQPRARRAAGQGGHELSRFAGCAGEPDHHHQLRRGAAGLHRKDRGVLGQEPARAFPRQAPLSAVRTAARGARALLAVAALFGGCAGVTDVTGTATQDDVLQLRTELTRLQTSVRQMRSQVDALGGPQADSRLRDRTADLERQTSSLTRRLDELSSTVTTLSARVEELTSTVDSLNRQLRSAPRTAPGTTSPPTAAPAVPPTATPVPPTTAAPGGPTAAPVPPTAAPLGGSTATPAPGAGPRPGSTAPGTPSAPSPPAVAAIPPGARPSTGALDPQDLYQAAYIDFSKGSYELAINGFRDFLRRYPDHPLASNAQYWIGEAHLALARGHADARRADESSRALQQAVQEFRKVLANYPRGDKAPAALYKEALALIELKQPDLAQSRLQYLIDNFPQAEETPLAREKLTALKER